MFLIWRGGFRKLSAFINCSYSVSFEFIILFDKNFKSLALG